MSGLKNKLNIMHRGVIVSSEIERVTFWVKKINCSLVVWLLKNIYYTEIDEGVVFKNYKVHTNGSWWRTVYVRGQYRPMEKGEIDDQ